MRQAGGWTAITRQPGGWLVALALCVGPWAGLARAQAPVPQPADRPPQALSPDRQERPIRAVQLLPGEQLPRDGSLDHPAWQRAPVHSAFVEQVPVNGGAVRQRTELRVLFDERALYVGVRAFEADVRRLRAPLVRHDGVNRTQDFIEVNLDAIGNRQSAQVFRVNAAGSTADGMRNAADDSEDFAPDFDFDAAARIDAQGYTVVLRIPFGSLRFAADGAQQPWRILVARRTPGEQVVLDTSAWVPREAAAFIGTMQPLQGVALPPHAQFLSLRPSLTWRHERTQGDGQPPASRSRWDATLDLKWRPRPELVVDGTLNPDFSQVALDVPQLSGNTRYALQLAEKRPFFFESSDLLRSLVDAMYTRSFTAPRAGLRATWRGSALAGTVFGIADRGGGSVLLPDAYGTGYAEQPASRALAGRARLDDGALQWGALAVARRYDGGGGDGGDAGDNLVAGPDLAWQLSEAWRLRAQWLASRTSALPVVRPDGRTVLQRQGPVSGQHSALKAVYQTQPFELEGWYDESSAGFRHDSGFINQVDVRHGYARVGWGWQGLGPFNDFWLNVDADQVRQRSSGQLVSRDWWPNLWLTGPHNLEWALGWHGQAVQRTAAGAPLLREHYWRTTGTLTPARWFPLLETHLKWGRLADVGADRVRRGASGDLTLRTRPLSWLELEPGVWFTRLQGDGAPAEPALAWRETAAQLLAVAHLDARQSLRAIVQHSRAERAAAPGLAGWADGGTVGSLTYTHRRSAGTVLYVGASRQRQGLGAVSRGNEVFIKLQVDADELRAGF